MYLGSEEAGSSLFHFNEFLVYPLLPMLSGIYADNIEFIPNGLEQFCSSRFSFHCLLQFRFIHIGRFS